MANLAEAVDAAETDWLVSASIPDSVDYLTVESEVVQVTATFPAQYQARDGSTSEPRIRVVRAAGGTTAASHADGTTLTPLIPPSAGGGAGTPLSMDNTVDTPVDVTSVVAAGATFVGSEATLRGKDFYAQDTDPGAVGAGSVWKDTASSNNFWERNATDDGWDARFAPTAVAVVDLDATTANGALASGLGNAYAGASATAVDGNAFAGSTAETTEGAADARPSATTTNGSAVASPLANATDGTAAAGSEANASGTGFASVRSIATATTGEIQAGSYGLGQGGAIAGMTADVDGLGVPHLGFNAMVATPPTIPVIPAVPDAQDIADVLVALGLATQAP